MKVSCLIGPVRPIFRTRCRITTRLCATWEIPLACWRPVASPRLHHRWLGGSRRYSLVQITYHGFAMREVSMNSTSLYETNLLSIKGFSCLFSHRSHVYWFLPEEIKCVFPTYWLKKKCISEFCRTNPQELKCWSTFCVNYFLRYNLMMQYQPIVKRVNGTHEWAHRAYQLQSAPYHC